MDKIRNPKVKWDNKNNKSFGWGKTRTFAAGKYPMGWAVITIQGMNFTKPTIDPNLQPTGFGKSLDSSSQNYPQTKTYSPESKKYNQDYKPKEFKKENQYQNKTENKDNYQKKNENKPKNYNQDSSSTYNPFKNINKDKK